MGAEESLARHAHCGFGKLVARRLGHGGGCDVSMGSVHYGELPAGIGADDRNAVRWRQE